MEDKATLRELRQRYFVDRRWKDLVDVLEREIRVTEDREERLDLYEELGTVYAEHLQNAAKAFDAFRTVIDLRDDWTEDDAFEIYEQLLEIDPDFQPAFERVEETLRRRGDVDSLQNLAGRYIDLAEATVDEPSRFLQHQREAARLFERDLGAPESALMVLLASVNPQTWQTGILEDVERLVRETGQWREAIERLEQVIVGMSDSTGAGRLHKRLGFWALNAGLGESAAEHLRAALHHFPADGEVSEALSRLYRVEGRWDDVVSASRDRVSGAIDAVERREMLDRLIAVLKEAAEATSGAEKGRYLAQLGTLYDVERDDRMTAVSFWERALNAEPETLEAARPLIDHYMAENRWERAAPVLESVVKAAEAKRGLLEPRELNQRYVQYGRVLDNVGNEKLALHAYRQAYEIDRNNPHTVERLGLLLYEAGEFDQAYHLFIQLADRHEKSVDRGVLIDVLRKAASIKSRFADDRVAMGLIDRALRLDPENRETLRLAGEVAEASGDHELAMRARQKLIDSETDRTVKFAELVRMGDAWAATDERLEPAAKAYIAALDIEPHSVAVLRKLLEVFRAMQLWREAIGVLERLADLEEDRIKSANLYYTMGIIARDHVQSPERAVTYLERALDANPELLKAFEAIDRLLTDARAWKDLERAYRRMLHRVTENELNLSAERRNQLNHLLWTSLGEVYRSRLRDFTTAVEAYEAALAIRPEDDETRMILADLYDRTGANTDGAIEQHRSLLKKDPMRAESYRALYRAFMDRGEFDAAWCIAGISSWMEAGDRETDDYYRKYLGMNLRLAKGAFYPELLDLIYPREQNRVVNAIMAHLAVALREHFANSVKDYGVHPKKDRIDHTTSKIVFAQMYRYVTKTLGFSPAPHLYVRRDHPLGLKILNADPPALLIGSDVVDDTTDDRDMIFRLGRLLGWMRPEHYLAAIGNGPAQLQTMFVSALDWAAGRKPSAGRDGATIVKRLKGADSQTQMQLQALLRTYSQHASGPPDIAHWLTQADHACSRFGLVFCGDIQRAVLGVKREPRAMTLAGVEERVRNLVVYSASDAYFQVRRELGLAID